MGAETIQKQSSFGSTLETKVATERKAEFSEQTYWSTCSKKHTCWYFLILPFIITPPEDSVTERILRSEQYLSVIPLRHPDSRNYLGLSAYARNLKNQARSDFMHQHSQAQSKAMSSER